MTKRRSKKVVVCAVTIVMLATFGVLVLTIRARSAPYEFMSGATSDTIMFNKAPLAPRSSRHFKLQAEFNNVAQAARAELTTADGWRHSPVITTNDGSQVLHLDHGKDAVTIMAFANNRGVVTVVLGRPPTLGDRLAWLMSGTKTFPP